ncbi:MAG: hypothetical protein ABJL99_15605 [Aliishimia sp.]
MKKRNFDKKPLYRKVNTRTHGVRHGDGGKYKWQRNTKAEAAHPETSMHSGHRHGRDYTPLFKFLISRVGQAWDDVFSEAVGRLDETDPIFWIVAQNQDDARNIVRTGESSYFSGLYVDDAGTLQKTDPKLRAKTMIPTCHCCTHAFNGEVFGITKTLYDFKREWA